jgi:MFS family permease
MLQEKMTPLERRSVFSLTTVISLRLIGLFMILPVFTLYIGHLSGATPLLIGLATGIYGLTQAIFPIPLGMLSDRIGRKKIIAAGLVIFIIGSVVAACSTHIFSMIIGRALQGAGAIGSAAIALMADLTRENQRSKAMAINGMTIGVSFSLAMILGSVLEPWIHVSGIFLVAGTLGLLGILIIFYLTPTPPPARWHADAEPDIKQFLNLLKDPQLARFTFGIFILHVIFTASFVIAIPTSLQQSTGIPSNHQWWIYLPTLFLAFLISVMFIMVGERRQQLKHYFLGGIATLGLAELLSWFSMSHVSLATLNLFLFFTGFSILEAFLPSFVSRTAPPSRKGTALGIYSSSQYLGIFAGGILGGWVYGVFGVQYVYLFCMLLALVWWAIAFGMKNPQYSTSHQK